MRTRETAVASAVSLVVVILFRIFQRTFDDLDEELLLLEVVGYQIFLQPLEELCRDLYCQGAFCFHANLSSFKVFGEDALHIFRQCVQLQLFFSAMIFAWRSVDIMAQRFFFPSIGSAPFLDFASKAY